MSCPGEDAIVAFMQGTLAPTERSRIEEHLDVCPSCTALLAGMGHVFGSERDAETSEGATSNEAESGLYTLLRLQLAMVVLHAWGAVLAAPFFHKGMLALRAGSLTTFQIVVLALAVWTYTGLPWACANVLALRRRGRHAVRSIQLYSAAAVFSLFATPLALASLYFTRAAAVRSHEADSR
jgi:hypothetical protein